jgi:hypothetical protein
MVMKEVDFYRTLNSELKVEVQELKEENKQLKADLKSKSLISPSKVDVIRQFNANMSKVPGIYTSLFIS